MRLSMYVSILFSITLIFYLGGFSPIGIQLLSMTSQGTHGGIQKVASPGDLLDTVNPLSESKDILTMMMFTIIVSAGVMSFILGFSAIYIIPLLILFSILNFFVFPLSAVLDMTMPVEIRVIIIFLYNVITIMACVTFIRGGN